VKNWRAVDWVAMALAFGLSVTLILILVVTAVQIKNPRIPEVMLSENATQVLIAGMGGVIGVLGAYIGRNKPPEGLKCPTKYSIKRVMVMT
jgi:hypothetical protein